MIDIPPFKTPTDQDLYLDMFDDKLTAYITLLDKVKETMYGTGHGNYANLPGSCLEVVERITTNLINLTSHEYAHIKHNTLTNYTLGDK